MKKKINEKQINFKQKSYLWIIETASKYLGYASILAYILGDNVLKYFFI